MFINLPQDIGSLIKDSRKKRGWTQLKLAAEVGTMQKHISIIENDPSGTALKTVLKILKALELDINISPRDEKQSDQSDQADW